MKKILMWFLGRKRLLRAQKDSLAHYDRMVAWAKTQPQAEKVKEFIVVHGLGEGKNKT